MIPICVREFKLLLLFFSLSFDYTDVGDYIIPHDTPGSIDRDSDPDWDSGEEDADSSDMSVDLNVRYVCFLTSASNLIYIRSFLLE